MPEEEVTITYNTDIVKNCILADPTYMTPGPIDILLGADIFTETIQEEF